MSIFLLFSSWSRNQRCKKASVHHLCAGCDALLEEAISLTFFHEETEAKIVSIYQLRIQQDYWSTQGKKVEIDEAF